MRGIVKVGRVFGNTASHMRKAQRTIRRQPDLPRHIAIGDDKRQWAERTLQLSGVDVRVIGEAVQSGALLVGNHLSYLDIPLLMAQSPVCFVAKKELGNWPIIGKGCRVTETVLVDRSSLHSRRKTGEAIAAAVLEQQKAVAIFPSGTTSIGEQVPWKRGTFRIAKQYGIPVQPFRIRYSPERQTAFVDKDYLLPHMVRLFGGGRINAVIEFHQLIEVENPEIDCERWWRWSQQASLPVQSHPSRPSK